MRRIFLLLLTLALLLGAVYYTFFLKNPKVSENERSSSENEIVITIPPGSSVAALTDTLAAHQLLRSGIAFQLAARVLGVAKDLHAGRYRIAPGLSNTEIIRRLTGSEYALILRATFPEGITIYHAASIAKDKLGLDSGIFMRFAFDTAFLHSLGVPKEAKSGGGIFISGHLRIPAQRRSQSIADENDKALEAPRRRFALRASRRGKTFARRSDDRSLDRRSGI